MATKFVGYVPEVKEWADVKTGEKQKIDRVRLNVFDDSRPGCVGVDVQYYMVKHEDLQNICGVKEYDELCRYIGCRVFINMTLDVRSQKPIVNEIAFMEDKK